ncbi:MAG: TonB-dependent receptor, partial [Acidobacteria bacterium]|nr:TonB-dependent receptor [Acidobacteriota bacterium]
DPKLNATQYDFGFYIQNSYKISETIAASFGVRYENQTNIASNLNLAPRIGLIWAPKAKEKQKAIYQLPRISIGYGLFYSRFGLNNSVAVRQASDPSRLQYLITETNILDIYPNVPTVDLLQRFALPRTQRFIDDELETPYQSLLNITVSKKMPKGFTLNVTFSRGETLRQAFTQNINAPLAGTYFPQNPSSAVRPFGNVGNIYETQSVGQNKNNRININLNFPQSQKLFANLRYSYGRSRNNVVSGSGSSFDPYDFSEEFSSTTLDGIHNLGGYYYLTLPHKIFFGGDFSISSGTRFNITTGRDTNGDGYYSERPSFATDLNKAGLISTQYGILDPNPSPTDKLIPRNLGRGKTIFIFNSSISKTFGYNEDKKNKKPPRQTLTFSLRANNVFNIVNKANPIGNMASPNFLRSLSSFSDGGVLTINGAVQENFAGRSLSLSVGFGF